MAEYGTTLEEKLEEFETLIFNHPEKRQARVVGIVGVGGVGKTTLVKEFFKRRRSDYAGSSFLSYVSENEGRGNVTSLQSKLLSDLQGNGDIKIGSLDEGKAILVKNLESCHALIVLDDVRQLDAFLPIRHVLDPKSLILVTSRAKHVLRSGGILETSIYVLRRMNEQASRELFCSYAFSQSCPPQGFESLVQRFLDECYGLPLLLKPFGGLLCGENDLCKWEEVPYRFRILPTDIRTRLHICYDSLVEEEQEIFLDIACFSIGKDRDTWIGIWDESGWKGLVGFQNLMNKGLVQVDAENKIVMHDQLRNLGRYMVGDQLRNLGRYMVRDKVPRRFRRATIEYLREQLSSEITPVHGIRMYPGDTIVSSLEPFGMISNLHFLEAEGSVVESILTKVLSPKLMWLHWINCPHSSLPPWLPMHDLRVLEVAGKELKILWKCESQAPMHLRELIVDAPLSKFPKSLEQLKHLKMIEAKDAYLATLPEEFCYLPFLKYLKLKDYQILPDSDGNFSNIQLTDGRNQESISDSMDNLKNLNLTDLERCTSLEMLLTAIVWRHFQSP